MAAKTSRPGRTLLVFALILAAMYTAVALIGTWKPKLGLDLQGGQRITLQARTTTGGGVTAAKLDEAVGIINDRVNGAGVSEAEVSTQGSDIIIVEIPGKPDENLERSIGSTAQLRFRMVAQAIGPAQPATQGTPTTPSGTGSTTAPSGTATPGAPSTASTSGSTSSTSEQSPASGSGTAGTKNRVAAGWMRQSSPKPAQAGSTTSPTTSPSTTPSTEPPTTGSSTGAPTSTVGPPPGLVPPQLENITDPYQWVSQFKGSNPPTDWEQRLAAYDCDHPDPTQPGQLDIPDQPLLACDDQGNRYLLSPSMVDGTDVTNASAGIPQGGINYVVDLSFNGDGAKKFGDVTTRIAKNSSDTTLAGSQLAIVLDGKVLSAPVNDLPITGGQAEISGSVTNPFTQQQAESLANSLKYGALPLTFDTVDVTTQGPELASNQLAAGILAGIIGLLLVAIYCILYYRGLSMVIIASLIVAGLVTYAAILLLGHGYGFTLTLPGIAGLIVAIGITADSFIVYFERLRDEVREGRTLRTSVETGWVRARTTILAADAVSFLAALVLYIFAIGVVKGFAFTLGLSTLIDVFIVFMFTKPIVTLLSRTQFFGQGHKWSGLDRQHLGLPPLKPKPAASAAAAPSAGRGES